MHACAEFFLDVTDLKLVCKELSEVNTKWRKIGTSLNVTTGTLNLIGEMKSDPEDCLEKVLLEWVTKFKATANWKELVKALSSIPVGEALLSKLEKKYCQKGKIYARIFIYTSSH